MPAIASSDTPTGRKMRAGRPTSAAVCATARPWLPSVAATSSRTPVSSIRAAISANGSASAAPSRADSARAIACAAPSILKAGSPKRADSSFTHTRAAPSSWASAGSSTSRVGA